MTKRDTAQRTERAILLGAAAIAINGFITSFDAVRAAMVDSFGHLAPLVPLSFDAGIIVSSAAYIMLARKKEAPRWLRPVPHILTGVTVWFNVTVADDSLAGHIAHGAMVGLWSVAVMVAAHVARLRYELDEQNRTESVPLRRWLVDPFRSASLSRRMLLWDIREYPRALAYERARRYALGVVSVRYPPSRVMRRRRIPALLRYELQACEWPDEVTAALDAHVRYGGPWKAAVLEWLDGYTGTGTETGTPPPEREPVPIRVYVQVPVPAVQPVPVPVPGRHLESVPVPVPAKAVSAAAGTGTSPETGTGTSGISRTTRTAAELVPAAVLVADEYRATHGRDISGTAMASALRVNKGKALEVLRLMRAS